MIDRRRRDAAAIVVVEVAIVVTGRLVIVVVAVTAKVARFRQTDGDTAVVATCQQVTVVGRR